MDPRQPVLVASGQVTNKPKSPQKLTTPLDLMERACLEAFDDAGSSKIPEAIDTVYVVNIISWTYADPPGRLAERLRIAPSRTGYSSIGGNSPQWLLNRACREIASGEADCVLIAGAEAFASGAAARNFGVKLERGDRSKLPKTIGDDRPGLSPEEMACQLVTPAQIYPILENAYRNSLGRSLEQHQEALGSLMESFNIVARDNPYAWFPEARSASEIAKPSLENRMIALPYTKYMNAVIKVDQGAALVLCSAEKARSLGISSDRWVFPVSGADCSDVWYFSRRPDLHRSPAIAAAGKAVLESSGLSIHDIALVDLYSCFPVAVEIAATELGLPLDGSISLTLTGGLPYFGGPGNNYSTHAIAHMLHRLRASPNRTLGLVTALGWFVTKHSVGLYSTEPPTGGYRYCDMSAEQARIDAGELGWLGDNGARVRVVGYTVLYDRASNPERAPAVVETIDGPRLRAIAEVPLEAIEDPFTTDLCGLVGTIDLHARPRPVLRLG
jgi:acetyl-CoA C-acetyltransferase